MRFLAIPTLLPEYDEPYYEQVDVPDNAAKEEISKWRHKKQYYQNKKSILF
jgi:hypothetical protein